MKLLVGLLALKRSFVTVRNFRWQVRWNRFVPNFFLSCSSDWTVRFWREEQVHLLKLPSKPYTVRQYFSLPSDHQVRKLGCSKLA